MKSLFTKVFATGFVVTGALLANGQISVSGNTDNVFGEERVATTEELREFTKNVIQRHGKREVTEWYSYINALSENGEAYTYFTGTSIMPDSFTVQIFTDDNDNPYTSHVSLFACGQVFDPKSEHYALIPETPPLSKHNA